MNKIDKFKTRLNEAMEIRGLKAIDLSILTNISKSLLSQYKNGYCVPKKENLNLIANVLGVECSWLLGMDVPMEKETEYHSKIREKIKEKLIIATDEQLNKIFQYIEDIGV